jgi:hypothetical protein
VHQTRPNHLAPRSEFEVEATSSSERHSRSKSFVSTEP